MQKYMQQHGLIIKFLSAINQGNSVHNLQIIHFKLQICKYYLNRAKLFIKNTGKIIFQLLT